MNLELLTRQPTTRSKSTPILFVHGSWHAAWCWDEHFLSYFASKGYSSHALSLRGHGTSPNDKSLRWTSIRDYVADVLQVANSFDTPPILVGHSMGGYIVQKVLEAYTAPAAVLLASIPPSGTLASIVRAAMHHPLALAKVTFTLSMYPAISTPQLSKDFLFSSTMPDDQAHRYFTLLQDESFRVIALESALLALPRPAVVKTPLLVLGAANDRVFATTEIESTARAYNTQATIFPDMAHDMMLESGWQSVADKIINWLAERSL